jgi:plastocyanin
MATTPSRKALFTAFGVVLCLANSSCGKVADSAPQLPSAPLAPAVEIVEKASISGKITLQGIEPAKLTKVIDVGGNPFCTGHGQIVDSTWKVAENGALADVVITVTGSSRATNVPATAPLVDQTHCEFVPHALAIQPGQSVRFRNSDLTFHNIRISRAGDNLANLAQAARGDENVLQFSVPGAYRLECDVHRWMNAWVFVHEGIHSAVSSADGSYTINRALADGTYTVRAWHPQFSQPLSQTVTVQNGTATADFAFNHAEAIQL